MLEVVRGDVQARADRGERAEDHDVAVAPHERPLAVQHEHVGPRDREVRPPRREREPDAGERDDPRVDGPALRAVDDGVDRRDRADDPLAERDDHEQAVALRDVVGMPRRPAVAALGERTGPSISIPISTAAIANVSPIGRSTIASTTQNACATEIVQM